MKKVLFSLSILFLWFYNSIYAHDVVILANNVDMTASGNTVNFYASTWIWYDEWSLSDPGSMDGFLDVFQEQFHMSYDQSTCKIDILDVTNNVERAWLTDVTGLFTCNSTVDNIEAISVRSTLFKDISQDPVDTFVNIKLGENTRKLVLSSTDPEETIKKVATTQEKAVATVDTEKEWITQTEWFLENFKQFVMTGIEHIIFGPDHVLFVIALILVISSYRQILILASGFTIAHSITLILAGLWLIQLTASIVEPIIALSIVCVAAYNFYILWYKKEKTINIAAHFWVIFGFWLFHGLGFAGSLADTPIPHEYIIPLLIAFNIWVEFWQILIIAITAPLIIRLLKGRTKKSRNTLLIISGILITISLYWFIVRILG